MGNNYAIQATESYYSEAIKICNFIQKDTTVDELKIERQKYPNYTYDCGELYSNTALIKATALKNIALIEYMVAEEGKGLLYIGNNHGETPLHTAIINGDPITAKKLLDLGAPINIIGKESTPWIIRKASTAGTPFECASWTPLECALKCGEIEIATILLRRGAIEPKIKARNLIEKFLHNNLEKAKKEIMTKNEALFAMVTKKCLPFDVIGNIICKSVDLDR
ncbi:MAG: ankyrin repeat domain-containing protein [Candidatus Protochlamydia sp.]|nr:ankyrin repeat domain-containing protein [Candidatus Protochlamydia sp.]